MHRSFINLLALLPLVSLAHPTSHFDVGAHSDKVNSGPITLTKRTGVHSLTTDAGVVRPAALKREVSKVSSKLARGFSAYQQNTGSAHPSDTMKLASMHKAKRDGAPGTGLDPLTDDSGGLLWQGEIQVGTPPKTFTVDFDTGSSDLFLPGQNCNSNCQGHTIYDTSASSTAQDLGKKFTLAFGDGSSVQGETFTDVVSIAGITAVNQAVGAATEYSSGNAVQQFPPDGLMGMAFEQISVYRANPFFQTVVQQGPGGTGQGGQQNATTNTNNDDTRPATQKKVDHTNEMARHRRSTTKHVQPTLTTVRSSFGHAATSTLSSVQGPPTGTSIPGQSTIASPVFGFKLAANGSGLFLGGVDASVVSGDFTQVPVTQVGFWQVNLDSINVNSKPAASQLSVIIDTGTSLIVGDTQSVAAFYASIPGSKDATEEVGQEGAGFFTVPCNAIPDVSLTFAGKSFSISPETFNLGAISETDTENCLGGIVGQDLGDFWVIGDVFLQNVYTSFNVGTKEVGFANLA